MEIGVEVRKVDSQGRLILPADWRESEIVGVEEVYVVKRKGSLKILPKRKVDLTAFFDRIDLGVEAIGDWREFEKKFYEGRRQMRFLDANIFVYAYYKPKKPLTSREQRMKDEAKEVISRVNEEKEEVTTTVIHMAEAVNILKHGMSLESLTSVILGLFMPDNIKIIGVNRETYFAATELGHDLRLDPNDALIVEVMRLNDVKELYSFDEDFEKVEGIVRLPKL